MESNLQFHSDQLDRAVRDARELRAQLFTREGTPKFVPAEHERQEREILGILADKARAVGESAAEIETSAVAELAELESPDPLLLLAGLPASDLQQAAALAPFVRMIADAPAETNAAAQVERVVKAGQRPLAAALAVALAVHPATAPLADRLAHVVDPKRAGTIAKLTERRRDAAQLRTAAGSAVARAGHASDQAAIEASLRAGGRYRL